MRTIAVSSNVEAVVDDFSAFMSVLHSVKDSYHSSNLTEVE